MTVGSNDITRRTRTENQYTVLFFEIKSPAKIFIFAEKISIKSILGHLKPSLKKNLQTTKTNSRSNSLLRTGEPIFRLLASDWSIYQATRSILPDVGPT